MHHPSSGRARHAAALCAILVAASAGAAAADAGGFAVRRVFRIADDGASGSAPGAAPSPTPELAAWAGAPTPAELPALLAGAIRQAPALATATIDIAIAEARIQEASGIDDWRLDGDVTGRRSTTSFLGITSTQTTASVAADLGRALSSGGTVSLHIASDHSRTTSEIVMGEDREWSDVITATITQPLLRGRGRAVARAGLARAALTRDGAVLGRRAVAIAAVQTIIAAYWELAFAERQLAIRRASLGLIAERRRLTEAGIRGGRVAPSELLAVDQAVATQQELILAAEVGVVQRSILVRRAAGLPIEPGAIALASGADASAPARVATLDESLRRALDTSPELAQLAVQDKDAMIVIEVADNGLLPRLDAALTLGPSGRAETFTQALKNVPKFDEYTIIGSLTVQHDLGRNAARGALRAARLQRERLQITATDVRAQIAQAVAQEVATLELAARRVTLAQTAIDLAGKNIEVEQARFSLGKSTNFDVLQRQNELQQSELSKAQAEIDARKAEASLSALTGDLLAEYGISLDARR